MSRAIFTIVKSPGINRRYLRQGQPGRDYSAIKPLPNAPAIDVPIIPAADAAERECFYNVARHVAANEGKAVFGWAIWEWPSVNIEAIHHAIWEGPDGLVDLTPPSVSARAVTFVVDPAATFDVDDPLAAPRLATTYWHIHSAASRDYQTAHERQQYLSQILGERAINAESYRATTLAKDNARRQLLINLANSLADDDPCFCARGKPFSACCKSNFA